MEEKLCTPQKAFEIPILDALIEAGGKLSRSEIWNQLDKKLSLLPGDNRTLPGCGFLRWQKNADWVMWKLRKNGDTEGSFRTGWKITDKGRKRYKREKDSYDPKNFKPYHAREHQRIKRGKKQRIHNLPHPTEVTMSFLQDWGYKRGLNLLELGLEGVKEAYKEFYYQNVQISDEEYLNIVYGIFRDIKAYIEEKPTALPTSEQVCQWINLCYLFKHYWEGTKLFSMLDSNSVPQELYRITKKIVEACKNKY